MDSVSIFIFGGVLAAVIAAGFALVSPLQRWGIIQTGHSIFSRERELSRFSFLPPQLEKLIASTYDTFWNVAGHGTIDDVYGRFMCAVNLIDTERQLHGNPVDPSDLPAGTVGAGEKVLSFTPLKSTVGVGDATRYLLELRRHRANIFHKKILFEYQRKNGSLTYWLYDRKPLLTTAELMRRFPDEERGAFLKYCQELEAAERLQFGSETEIRVA